MPLDSHTQGGGDLEKAKHRGRAYQCLHCFNSGREVVDSKQRMEDHIKKYHLSLDKSAFYCSLCLFRCSDRSQLLDHVQGYSKHKQMVETSGKPDSPEYLKESPFPYKMGKADYFVFSQEASARYFLRKSQTRKGSAEDQDQVNNTVPCASYEPSISLPAQQPTSQLLNSLLMSLLGNMPPMSAISLPPMISDSNKYLSSGSAFDAVTTPVTIQADPPRVFGASETTSVAGPAVADACSVTGIGAPLAFGADASTHHLPVSMMATPPTFCASAGELDMSPFTALLTVPSTTTSGQTVSPPRQVQLSHFAPVSPAIPTMPVGTPPVLPSFEPESPLGMFCSESEQSMALDLTIQTDLKSNHVDATETEDILPQLLGSEEVTTDDLRVIKTVTTTPPFQESELPADRSETRPGDDKLGEAILEGNRMLREELDKNSRAIRCLEKQVGEQNSIMTSIKDTLDNFVAYIRMSAREERRREEKREEERKKEREEDRKREDERKKEDRKRKYTVEDQPNKRRREEDGNKENALKAKSLLGEATIQNRKH